MPQGMVSDAHHVDTADSCDRCCSCSVDLRCVFIQQAGSDPPLVADYGSPDDSADFKTLLPISPVHNVRVPAGGTRQYPAMLITTGAGPSYWQCNSRHCSQERQTLASSKLKRLCSASSWNWPWLPTGLEVEPCCGLSFDVAGAAGTPDRQMLARAWCINARAQQAHGIIASSRL